jgi:hypothetical protein
MASDTENGTKLMGRHRPKMAPKQKSVWHADFETRCSAMRYEIWKWHFRQVGAIWAMGLPNWRQEGGASGQCHRLPKRQRTGALLQNLAEVRGLLDWAAAFWSTVLPHSFQTCPSWRAVCSLPMSGPIQSGAAAPALQNLAEVRGLLDCAAAFWSVAVLCRFRLVRPVRWLRSTSRARE